MCARGEVLMRATSSKCQCLVWGVARVARVAKGGGGGGQQASAWSVGGHSARSTSPPPPASSFFPH